MSVPIVREVREYLDRVTSNYNKYVSNYSDQLLCSMYYDTVVPFIRSRNRIPTDYRFIKECLGGSRKSPVDPIDLSTVFSPRSLSSKNGMPVYLSAPPTLSKKAASRSGSVSMRACSSYSVPLSSNGRPGIARD